MTSLFSFLRPANQPADAVIMPLTLSTGPDAADLLARLRDALTPMSEMILPGTYIEVRPEGLIVPGHVTVNNVGMVGTAGKGPIDTPVLLGNYNEAREVFGDYDAWIDGQSNELTLVRALQQAFAFGATSGWAVRIVDGAEAASFMLASAGGDCVNLEAKSKGEWGNEIEVIVTDADTHSFVSGETHSGAGAITLNYPPIVASGRNRISVFVDATQRTRQFNIIYSGTPDPGQVHLDTDGTLTFHTDDEPDAADTVTASYVVNMSASVKVTLRLDTVEEMYTVANGNSLAAGAQSQPDGRYCQTHRQDLTEVTYA